MAKVYNVKHILARFGNKHLATLQQIKVKCAKELHRDGLTKEVYIVANPALDAWVSKQNTFNAMANVKTVKHTYKNVEW
jgi:hypothetical protein